MTVGPSDGVPSRRPEETMGIVSSHQLKNLLDGSATTVTGHVIVRQRQTVKGGFF
jgi:hypothetical protein